MFGQWLNAHETARISAVHTAWRKLLGSNKYNFSVFPWRLNAISTIQKINLSRAYKIPNETLHISLRPKQVSVSWTIATIKPWFCCKNFFFQNQNILMNAWKHYFASYKFSHSNSNMELMINELYFNNPPV